MPLLFLIAASSGACSSPEQHPSQIGDCIGSANACVGGKVGSGSGGPTDDGGSASDLDADDEGASDEASSDDGSGLGQSCGLLVFQPIACETCIENGCCDQTQMCSADPDCTLYLQCLSPCKPTDTKCASDCQMSNPLGFNSSRALEQCIGEKCSTQCQ